VPKKLSTKSTYRCHPVHVHGMKVQLTERDTISVKIENTDFLPINLIATITVRYVTSPLPIGVLNGS
jgi:hypothetical protein